MVFVNGSMNSTLRLIYHSEQNETVVQATCYILCTFFLKWLCAFSTFERAVTRQNGKLGSLKKQIIILWRHKINAHGVKKRQAEKAGQKLARMYKKLVSNNQIKTFFKKNLTIEFIVSIPPFFKILQFYGTMHFQWFDVRMEHKSILDLSRRWRRHPIVLTHFMLLLFFHLFQP